jgi:hypothetical protein
MKIDYKLNEQDFIIHMWYQLESDSTNFKKEKLKFYLRFISYVICFGLPLSLLLNNYLYLIVCILISPFTLFFTPLLYKKRKQQEIKVIAENHTRKRDSENATLIIKDDFIISKEDFYESKHFKTEIDNIVEIDKHFIINCLTDQNKLIIPKLYISDSNEFINLISNMGIKYIDDSDWKNEKKLLTTAIK